jgi:hypothetical protein
MSYEGSVYYCNTDVTEGDPCQDSGSCTPDEGFSEFIWYPL